MDLPCNRLNRTPEVNEKCNGGTSRDNANGALGDLSSRHYHTVPPTYDSDVMLEPEPGPLTRKVRLRDQISIIIGPPAVLLLDLAAPCMIYYIWLDGARSRWKVDCAPYFNASRPCPIPRPVYDSHILGTSIVFFGLGELYILLARVYRLVRYHDTYAPLLSARWWQLDATAWIYASALIVGLIPFVVSVSVGQGIFWLFLYAPGFLIAYLEIWAIITLLPFKLPVQVDSDPVASPIQPLVYYAAEDFIAVDGCQGREFRRRYQARYRTSASFRHIMRHLTYFWIVGCTIYLACVSVIIWNLEFELAFGSSLGLLFFWVILWAFLTFLWANLKRHE